MSARAKLFEPQDNWERLPQYDGWLKPDGTFVADAQVAGIHPLPPEPRIIWDPPWVKSVKGRPNWRYATPEDEAQ